MFVNMNNTTDGSRNVSDGMDVTNYIEYQLGVLIWKAASPVMIILGTIGNILSIMVLTKKSVRNNTSALYLTLLSVSDLISLYTGLLRQWMIYAFSIDIREYNSIICKFHLFLVYFSVDFSAWLLVAVTFDRVVKTCFPYAAKTKCTRCSAISATVAVAIILISLNCHILYGMGAAAKTINGVVTIEQCQYTNPQYKDFFENIWPWMDFVVFCILPFCLLLTGNTIIVVKLFSSFKASHVKVGPEPNITVKKQENKMKTTQADNNSVRGIELPALTIQPPTPKDPLNSPNSSIVMKRASSDIASDRERTTKIQPEIFKFPSTSSNNATSSRSFISNELSPNISVNEPPSGLMSSQPNMDNEPFDRKLNKSPAGQTGKKKTPKNRLSSTSCTLFALNTVFLLSTTPISIYLVGYNYWEKNASLYETAVLEMGWSIVNILMYTNNTFNFLLYCLSGSRFRSELKQLLVKCWKNQ